MNIVSWNVNGIRAVLKKGSLYPFLEECKPDVLCLQETKANSDQVQINLEGYYDFWNSATRKGYSGTAIFSKTEPVSVLYGFHPDVAVSDHLADVYGDTREEGRVLSVEFLNMWVVTVYTPNAKDDLSRIPMRLAWDPTFLAHCKRLEQDKPVVFCGDLNVAHTELDLARPKQNEGKKGFTEEERSGFQSFIDEGFVDTFRLFHQEGGYYTWWAHWGQARARNVGWRIDYVLVSKSLVPRVRGSTIHPEVMGSDHCPVSIDLEV